jgi:hypothetical protein
MNSGAAFREESEYVIGFKIWATYDELLPIFRKKYFFAKNAKKAKKVFDPYLYENKVELLKLDYQNDQRKKL